MVLMLLKIAIFLVIMNGQGNVMGQQAAIEVDGGQSFQGAAGDQKGAHDDGMLASKTLWELVLKFMQQKADYIKDEKNLATLRTGIKKLLDRGADINVQNDKGKTLIFAATYFRCYPVFVMLDQNKADIGIADKKGYTPLHYAAKEADMRLVHILLGTRSYQKNPIKILTLETKGKENSVQIARRLLHYWISKKNKKICDLQLDQKQQGHPLMQEYNNHISSYQEVEEILNHAYRLVQKKKRIGQKSYDIA